MCIYRMFCCYMSSLLCSSGDSPDMCKMIALCCCLCLPPIPLFTIHLGLCFFNWIKPVILPLLLVLVLIVGLVVWCGRSVVLRSLNKRATSSHSRCCCRCATRGRDIWISCCHWVGVCRWCTDTWVTTSPTTPIWSWISSSTSAPTRSFLRMAWQQHRIERWLNAQFWKCK